MTAWDQLAERIDADDADGVVRLCAGLSEIERRPFAVQALARYRADQRNTVAGLVVLATGGRSAVDQLWPLVTSEQPEACVAILVDRQPSWLGGWLTARLENEPLWAAFEVAWRLRLRGLYAADGPGYTLAFVAAVGNSVLHPRAPIYDLLVTHRSLLDDELWRAFQVEGGGQTSFAAHDKYMPAARSWSVALRRLSDEGLIDRARLIDATLEALARGYGAFRAGWFVRFHDSLELTDAERKVRGERYLDLLGSPTPQLQSFAVRAVAALDELEPVPAPRLIRALRQAVLNSARATATQALRLIETAARRDPGAGNLAALAAAEALVHEAPDVQAQALSVLERHRHPGDPELERALASAAAVLAPSLRSRLGPLTSSASVPAGRPESAAAATAWPDAILDAHVLRFREALRPVESTAELALVVGRAIEHPGEIDTLEQALDGISRLCRASRAEPAAIWAPLRKRAGKLYRVGRAFRGQGLHTDFPGVVVAWLNREPPSPLGDDLPTTALGFLSARLHAVAVTAGSGDARPLLSAPTHAGGWIDPEVLVARLPTADHAPADRADLVLALLRLAPERRAEALRSTAVAEGTTEAAAALRFALGSDRERPGPALEGWVAAVRARYPGSDARNVEDAALANLRAGALSIARPTLRVTRRPAKDSNVVWHDLRVGVTRATDPLPSPLFPTVSMHTNTHGTGAFAEADVRWCATLHPSDLEPLFTEGVAQIGNNLDWWSAHWAERAYLEPLLELRTSFSAMAVRLVTLAMAAKEPGIRGLAAEITARALADGRLPVEILGRSLGEWWASPLVTPRRLVVALASAAATSPATGGLVRQAMRSALRTSPHADAAAILELFHELSCADGVGLSDPLARATLAEYRSGKAGRLASRVLAL